MSSSSAYNHDDEEACESMEDQSPWTVVWQNNKGATLILLAEAFASSSDAIVRFLQQGGHGMHPFQVNTLPLIETPYSRGAGHLFPYGYHTHFKYFVYVVDENSRFSTRSSKRSTLASSKISFWLLWIILLIL
jgi:hypothetical protein